MKTGRIEFSPDYKPVPCPRCRTGDAQGNPLCYDCAVEVGWTPVESPPSPIERAIDAAGKRYVCVKCGAGDPYETVMCPPAHRDIDRLERAVLSAAKEWNVAWDEAREKSMFYSETAQLRLKADWKLKKAIDALLEFEKE